MMLFSRRKYFHWILCFMHIHCHGFLFFDMKDFNGNLLNKDCHEAPVEERENMADIVVTGTVKGILPDPSHKPMYKAQVQVKRIMKGENIIGVSDDSRIPGSKIVLVEGFGDPGICKSDIRLFDTRILMLSKGYNGVLRLNSSIVRISVTSLDRIDHAVKDAPYQPPPEKTKSLCEINFCPFHAECNDDSGEIECRCILVCMADEGEPMCGTDGTTYDNYCRLKRTSCMEKRRINIAYDGPCKKEDPCGKSNCTSPQVCQLDKDRNPVCKCVEKCEERMDIVCGTNGQEYGNLCLLEQHACRSGKDIKVLNEGKCPGNNSCASKCPYGSCRINNRNEAVCECPQCTPNIQPVCGSNGQSYDSMCQLERFACLNNENVVKQSDGSCDQLCKYKNCGKYEKCEMKHGEGICVPVQCETCSGIIRPVCGSDNKSYDNECELRKANCQLRKNVRKIHDGYCGGCGMNKGPCQHYATCRRVGNSHRCMCPSAQDCPRSGPKICGSDGVTYENECMMQVMSCLNNKTVAMTDRFGECQKCDPECTMYSRCIDGQCVCPLCSAGGQKVCAGNGETFDNECKFQKYVCEKRIQMSFDIGPCDGEGSGSGESGEVSCDWSDGSGDFERVLICDDSSCPYGGICLPKPNGEFFCSCDFGCIAIRDLVCGSDGHMYGSVCQMQEAGCREKKVIVQSEMEHCENDIVEEPCDGNPPLIDPATGQDYHCTSLCPPKSYCHVPFGKCCREDRLSSQVVGCQKSRYGCCPDKVTSAPAPNFNGCPTKCKCNKYGSRLATCDPVTGACECHHGVIGSKCNSCQRNYWGLKQQNGCQPCDCNEFGSTRPDCNQNTGECACRPGISGKQCEYCPDGSQVTFNVCKMDEILYRYPRKNCQDGSLCSFGAYCDQVGNDAICKCDNLPCLRNQQLYSQKSVCGSDGDTYRSECHMAFTSCARQEKIEMIYDGPCQQTATRPSHITLASRSRKTTRHINGKLDVTKIMNSKTTRKPRNDWANGKISDRCYHSSQCMASNSECRLGVCTCLPGFITTLDGQDCQEVHTVKPDESMKGFLDPCSDSPCLNNGQCQLDDNLGFRCLCPLQKSGTSCYENAKITTPAFTGHSHLQLKQMVKATDDIMLEIGLSTLNNDGIVTFASQYSNGTGDFIAVTVVNGYLEFRYNLGSGMAVIRSNNPLKKKEFNKVLVSRVGKKGYLRLNSNPIVEGESPGSLTSLDLNGFFFLGSVPEMTQRMADKIGVDIGLAGCIENFQAGSTESPYFYDLSYPSSSDNLVGGLDIHDCADHNPCSSLPCYNGGSCFMSNREVYKCACEVGYTGSRCEVILNPCLKALCQKGSTCVLRSNGAAECICPENMEGQFCEYEKLEPLSVPEFTGSSLTDMPLKEVDSSSLSIRIWFKSYRPNDASRFLSPALVKEGMINVGLSVNNSMGVLLYASQYSNGIGDYISLNIIKRHLEFRFNMGAKTVIIKSRHPIKLDTWHEVLIQTEDKTGTLQIDNNNSWRYTAKSQGISFELNLQSSMLHLGGFKSKVPPDSNISRNFTGVIQRIYINGNQYDNLLKVANKSINIIKYEGPPCLPSPCLNGGVCVPKLADFECRCPVRYMGRRCEKIAETTEITSEDLPVEFDGTTFLKYLNNINIEHTSQRVNRYSVTFSTSQAGGLLLYQSGTNMNSILDDYLLLAVVNGTVEFSYNLGKQTQSNLHIIKSAIRVDDGKWHRVIAIREKRMGSLQVDDEVPVRKESTVGLEQLNTDGMLWIGGKMELPLDLPKKYSIGFHGCIKDVLIDYKALHLIQNINGQSNSRIKFCRSL